MSKYDDLLDAGAALEKRVKDMGVRLSGEARYWTVHQHEVKEHLTKLDDQILRLSMVEVPLAEEFEKRVKSLEWQQQDTERLHKRVSDLEKSHETERGLRLRLLDDEDRRIRKAGATYVWEAAEAKRELRALQVRYDKLREAALLVAYEDGCSRPPYSIRLGELTALRGVLEETDA